MSAIINKDSLITQIDSIIAGLNLSTDETQSLSLYYKTAINAGASASSVAAEIISRAQNTSSAASLQELLLLAVSANLATKNRVLSVPTPAALSALTNISAGSIYYVDSEGAPYIRKSDGSWVIIDPTLQTNFVINAYAWGSGTSGRLGDNTIVNKSSPVSVVGELTFTDWVQISAGSGFSIGLRANGTAWGWGLTAFGQIGDNTVVAKSSPVSVVGGFTDWTQVSAGGSNSAGLRSNGTIWTWGYNLNGQLGDNTALNKSSPVSVVGGFTDWTQVSVGSNHCLGLRANGTAWAWGNAAAGRLGDNTIVSKSSPVSVVGGFTDWVQLSASGTHSLGVRANGTAWAWGGNTGGRLGDNTAITASKSSPVSVVGGFTDWVQVSAGGNHSLGVRANGTAWAWGNAAYGQLGNNTATTASTSSPVAVIGGFTDWIQVNAGTFHSLGVRANGTAWAWGYNLSAQLGDNTIVNKSSPVIIVGGFANWIQLDGGSDHSLGIVT